LLRGSFDLSFSVLTATMPKIDSPHRTDYVIITMKDYKVFRFETYLNRKEIKYLESIKR
jgi:hypothetical protein